MPEPFAVAVVDNARFTECRTLWLALRDHHGAGDPQMGALREDKESWTLIQDWWRKACADQEAFLVLAESGDPQDATDGPLGCGMVSVRPGSPTWTAPHRFGHLEILSVLPRARGLGVGTRIVEVVQAELDRRGHGECRITALAGNLGAQAFYRELGFETFALELRRPAPEPPAQA